MIIIFTHPFNPLIRCTTSLYIPSRVLNFSDFYDTSTGALAMHRQANADIPESEPKVSEAKT
jgi:hypothetical protein